MKKYNKWDKKLFFACINKYPDKIKTIVEICRITKTNAENGRKKENFPSSVKRLSEEGIILTKDGYSINLDKISTTINGTINKQLSEGYIAAAKIKPDLFLEVMSNKKFTFAEWVIKLGELQQTLIDSQIDLVKNMKSQM
jgi:hypothetical protein